MRAPCNSDATDMASEDQGTVASKQSCNPNVREISELQQENNLSETAVFGICLDQLMKREPKLTVPFVLSRLCCFIEKHGLHKDCLFQDNEEKKLVTHLKLLFNKCGDAPLEFSGNVSSASKLLKHFFEELPEPLIPLSMQTAFTDNLEKLIPNSVECIRHLKFLVSKLPESVFCVLRYLSNFLLKLASCHEYNGLSCADLGVIFGPILFRPTKDDPILYVFVKKIMHNFVSDYYAIFEESALSCDKHLDSTSDPILIFHSPGKQKQMMLHPSSVMPVVPMQPLSVLIPPVDMPGNSEQLTGENQNVPVLIIESKSNMESAALIGLPSKDIESIDCVLQLACKHKEGLSNESIMYKDKPSVFEITSINNDNMHKSSNWKKTDIVKNSSGMDYASLSLKVECEDFSPRSPKPKRRELDILDSVKSDSLCYKYCMYPSNHQSWTNVTSVFKEENSMKNQNINLDLMLHYDNQSQVFLSENEISSAGDSCAILETNSLKNKKTLPRPASCPIPNNENLFSESESISPSWSTLLNSEEPVCSEHRLSWPFKESGQDNDALLSPSVHSLRKSSSFEAPLSPSAYRGYLCNRSSSLDSSIPPSPPVKQDDFGKCEVQDDVTTQIKKLTKKIHVLKKKIRRFEEKFEHDYGYRPSHAEKSNFPEAKKLMTDLHKARKELKAVKEECHLTSHATKNWYSAQEVHILEDTTNCLKDGSETVKESGIKKPTIQISLGETLKSLDDERKLANRPELIEDMTEDQVQDEKIAIQKALLRFESIHGKPYKKNDRNTVRPLYDRYRNIKQLLTKAEPSSGNCIKSKETCGELQPIMEHETMDFSVPQHRRDENFSSSSEDMSQLKINSVLNDVENSFNSKSPCSQYLDNKYNNSNLHELPVSEMIYQQQQARSEKRRLRKILKEFEMEFQRLNGRKVQKEDKMPVEALYAEYKHVKARLRLLEALLSKHRGYDLM